jgi:hypothetical protein
VDLGQRGVDRVAEVALVVVIGDDDAHAHGCASAARS